MKTCNVDLVTGVILITALVTYFLALRLFSFELKQNALLSQEIDKQHVENRRLEVEISQLESNIKFFLFFQKFSATKNKTISAFNTTSQGVVDCQKDQQLKKLSKDLNSNRFLPLTDWTTYFDNQMGPNPVLDPNLIILEDNSMLVAHRVDDAIRIFSSSGGKTWELATTLKFELEMSSLFQTKSGVYLLGIIKSKEGLGSIHISKMDEGSKGSSWGTPTPIHIQGETFPICELASIPAAISVEDDQVIKMFQGYDNCLPALVPQSRTRVDMTLWMNTTRRSFTLIDIPVEKTSDFTVNHSLLRIDLPHAEMKHLYVRLLNVNQTTKTLTVRIMPTQENYQLPNINLPKGSLIQQQAKDGLIAANEVVIFALETHTNQDLTKAHWKISNRVQSPIPTYAEELSRLLPSSFGVENEEQRRALSSFKNPELTFLGSGYPYWSLGSLFPLKHGGRTALHIAVMRMKNPGICSLSARVEVKTRPHSVVLEYQKMLYTPNLATGPSSMIWDPQAGIYWMVSNVNRDRIQDCEDDSSSLGLFVSKNSIDWIFMGIVVKANSFQHIHSFPMIQIYNQTDLAIVARAKYADISDPQTILNSLYFGIIRDFRQLVDLSYLKYEITK